MTSDGDVRASVAIDPERLASLIAEGGALDFAHLAGKGHLAMTVDQGEDTDRYQGIVAIEGRTLADTAISYFRQSEQIGSALLLAAEGPEGGFGWRAGGLLLQRLPSANAALAGPEEADAWETAKVLLQSLTDRELLDPTLSATELLRRLFHQSGLAVYDPGDVRFACRCSRQRIETVLAGLPPDDLEHAATDGPIEVTCDFCKTRYIFDVGDIPSKPRSE
jgi:molecular chaperone Hsp33